MVGQKLVTKQTPADGVLVSKVMVAEALDIERETYLAILMDRGYNGPVIVGSSQGGVDIEEVAAKNPEAIFKVRDRSYKLSFLKKQDLKKNAVKYLNMCDKNNTKLFWL